MNRNFKKPPMKDNFSSQSAQYARYRPTYPKELFQWLVSLVPTARKAWDCGTGNGQVARELANYFAQVYATDLSRQQIENARPHPKVSYSVQKAEKVSFPAHSFDLITVAQAIHWFDFKAFYREVYRTLWPTTGLLAVMGYGFIQTFPEADAQIGYLYREIVGPFWDPERKYVEEGYRTIPFPFREIKSPLFTIELDWTVDHLIGYLQTWSAVNHYQKEKNQNPVDLIYHDLESCWGTRKIKKVKFPIFLRVGQLNQRL